MLLFRNSSHQVSFAQLMQDSHIKPTAIAQKWSKLRIQNDVCEWRLKLLCSFGNFVAFAYSHYLPSPCNNFHSHSSSQNNHVYFHSSRTAVGKWKSRSLTHNFYYPPERNIAVVESAEGREKLWKVQKLISKRMTYLTYRRYKRKKRILQLSQLTARDAGHIVPRRRRDETLQ